MNGLMLPGRQVFLVDTHVNADPTAEQLAEITAMAAEEMLRFGMQPKAALLSHSNFGTSDHPSAGQDAPHAGPAARSRRPGWRSTARCTATWRWTATERADAAQHAAGEANLLVLPNIDAANIAYNLLKTAAGGGIAIGPVLLGAAKPVHILTPSATVRRIVNMTAVTVADAEAGRVRVQPGRPPRLLPALRQPHALQLGTLAGRDACRPCADRGAAGSRALGACLLRHPCAVARRQRCIAQENPAERTTARAGTRRRQTMRDTPPCPGSI
jgi:hypothetical protein